MEATKETSVRKLHEQMRGYPAMPVVFETIKPACRVRIGGRGLYGGALAALGNGELLACTHFGSEQLQQVGIWRSIDQGKTWQQVATQGAELYGSGAMLHALTAGAVLLHTGALYRSADNGVTWDKIACPETGSVRNVIEQPDGTIEIFGSQTSWYAGQEAPPRTLAAEGAPWYREGAAGTVVRRRTWRIHSTDAGETWAAGEDVLNDKFYLPVDPDWSQVQPMFYEASMVRVGASRLLAATRRSDPSRTVLTESTDGGATWSQPREFLQQGEIHAHLLVLKDGRLLCTYLRQDPPRSIFAVLSSDEGKTWDTERPTYLTGTLADLYGWPNSLEMVDGTILTLYTMKAYEESTQINDSVTEAVRWELPGSDEGLVKPASQPVFAQEHDYSMYPVGITIFTGRSLQEIRHCRMHAAERFQVPGYKGALARFPDGELLFCNQADKPDTHTVVYRSRDEGRTWQPIAMQGDTIPGKEQALICLADNKTVLMQTEDNMDVLYRSTDRGVTWHTIDYGHAMGIITRNFVELSDGSVLKFGCKGVHGCDVENASDLPRTTAWRLRSTDGGLTWPARHEIPTWDSPEHFMAEPFVLPFSDRHFLAATRVGGDFARKFAGAPPIGVGAGAGGETDEGMVTMESFDAGLTWSEPRWMGLPYSAVHAYLTPLADGRILCSYRRRFLNFGVAAVLSEDQGRTWDTARPMLVGVRPTGYGGWPTTLQLEDGTLLTGRGFMIWPEAIYETIRWRLLDVG